MTLFTGVQTPLGGENSPFPGATVNIISDTNEHLEAILQLTVPIADGDTLLLSSFVNGIATPEPGDGAVEDGLDVRASHGIVDFSNTGALTIIVPEGVSISGSDALLANIVVTAPVPVPAAIWLFGSVLGLLGWRHRKVA